jgi:hypothetical protein
VELGFFKARQPSRNLRRNDEAPEHITNLSQSIQIELRKING